MTNSTKSILNLIINKHFCDLLAPAASAMDWNNPAYRWYAGLFQSIYITFNSKKVLKKEFFFYTLLHCLFKRTNNMLDKMQQKLGADFVGYKNKAIIALETCGLRNPLC